MTLRDAIRLSDDSSAVRIPPKFRRVLLALAAAAAVALSGWGVLSAQKPFREYPDRKSTRLNSSHSDRSRMPSSA